MIEAIPNQPIAFDDSRLRGCCTIDPDDCLLIVPSDQIIFQVAAERCADDVQVLSDPGFDSGTDWDPNGWTITDGQACKSIGPFGDITGTTLTETGYTATPGTLYEVLVLVDESTSRTGVSVYFGGVLLGNVRDAGEYIFMVTATTSASVVLVSNLDPGESICIESVLVWERSTDFTVEFVDQSDTVVETLTYGDDGITFELVEDRMTVTIDLDNDAIDVPNGCYTLQITDGCDDVTLVSQCVNVGDHACTVMLIACANGELLGFKNGFRPQMRVNADLKRQKFSYEFREEKLSNGTLNRYYAERNRKMDLCIAKVGEFSHNFLSTLPLWDHVYIGQEEYVVTSEAYEPGYEDVYSSTGAILLEVTPYRENARKVRCVEDNSGCAPPPNYWVQGTGPNEDYILQEETGERILLN